MSYEWFIAKKVLTAGKRSNKVINPVVLIAMAGITLGVAVMLVAVMVVTGFRHEITDKVIGFGSHIRIGNFDSNNSYEDVPIVIDEDLVNRIKKINGIKNIQEYATKAGIIKTNDEIQGTVLKGVTRNFNRDYIDKKLVDGSFISFSDSNSLNQIVISKKISSLLSLETGDDVIIYFIEDPPRIRKLKITGIYETGLDEFDNIYVFCNLDLIRKLNNWDSNQANGIEMSIENYNDLDAMTDKVYYTAGFGYYTQNIEEQYPQIFHWLDLQNINVIIIITLILLIAGISMISTLLIIILENTTIIGILKALGSKTTSIRKIFIYISMPVIGAGIIMGNLIGLGLCFIQWKFGIISLPQESYYVSQVPVNFSVFNILALNAVTIIVCFLLLIGPSMVVARITPARVIRFD